MTRCEDCGDQQCHRCASIDALRAENRDIKAKLRDREARLAEMRRRIPPKRDPYCGDSWTTPQFNAEKDKTDRINAEREELLRITDLRRKNWRKP